MTRTGDAARQGTGARRRGTRAVATILIVAGALGTGIGAYVANRAGPPFETVDAGGIGTATVHVDVHGVPRIVASSLDALFFAQGYVQGRDGLFMADLARRIGSGRLAELLGDSQVDKDLLMHAIDIPGIARASIARTSPATLRLCQAYIDGINSYARGARGRLPIEYDILKATGLPLVYRIEPFTVEDIMHVLLYLAFEFSSNLGFNVGMHDFVSAIGVDAFAGFKRYLKAGDEYTITEACMEIPAGAGRASTAPAASAMLASPRLAGSAGGSNAWAVAGSRTASGVPMLASDPHMKVSTPGLLKSWSLACPAEDLVLVGAQLPLVPGIFIGRNDHVAWGMTAPFLDCGDAWWESIDAGGGRYWYNGSYHPIRSSTVSIWSSSGKIHERTIERVPGHGVLLDIDGTTVSYRWAAMIDERPDSNGSALLDALFSMFTARDAGNVMDVMGNPASGWDDFPLHVIFATRGGDIGFVGAGRVPVRGNQVSRGAVPLDGRSPDNDWIRFTAPGEIQHVVNPPEGMVYAANSKVSFPTAGSPPAYLAPGWGNAYRQNRIRDVLAGWSAATIDDMRRLQGDVMDQWAPVLVPCILAAVGGLGEPHATARQQLAAWDHAYTRDSTGASIYAAFVKHYGYAILGDELGLTHDQSPATNLHRVFKHVVHAEILVNLTLDYESSAGARALFDDAGTGTIETRDDIITRAFLAATGELAATLGPDPRMWRWARYNVVEFKHPFNANGRIIGALNLGPYELDGGHAVRMQRGDECAATRFLVAWTPVPFTSVVTPPGPRGNPLAAGRDTEMALYAANALKPYVDGVAGLPVIVSIT